MKSQNIVSTILKITGIYAIIQSLPMFQAAVSYLGISQFTPNEQSKLLSASALAFIPTVFQVGLGLYLIISSNSLASRFINQKKNEIKSERQGINSSEFQAISFSIVGVLLIGISMPKLMQTAVRTALAYTQPVEQRLTENLLSIWPHLSSVIFQLALGIFLFFGSKGLASYWRKLQKTRPMSKDS